MNKVTERVIEKLRKANKCGRYSDATIEKVLEEVLEEQRKESECTCDQKKEEINEEVKEPLTLKEILDRTPINLDTKYKQILLVTQDEDEGVCSICVGNPAGPKDRIELYYEIKSKLSEIMLEGMPKSIIKLVESFYEK